jgi:hypothetical protein
LASLNFTGRDYYYVDVIINLYLLNVTVSAHLKLRGSITAHLNPHYYYKLTAPPPQQKGMNMDIIAGIFLVITIIVLACVTCKYLEK